MSAEHATKLTIWTIYQSPSDHPGKWVLRGHDIPGGPQAECLVGNSLEEIRLAVPPGLICMDHDPLDDPVIVESWV